MLPSNCWDATLEHVHTAQKSLHSPVIAETALNLFTHTAHKSMRCEVTAGGNKMLNLSTCSQVTAGWNRMLNLFTRSARKSLHCQVTAGWNRMLNQFTHKPLHCQVIAEVQCWTCPTFSTHCKSQHCQITGETWYFMLNMLICSACKSLYCQTTAESWLIHSTCYMPHNKGTWFWGVATCSLSCHAVLLSTCG